MSVVNYIVCSPCGRKIWVGQNDNFYYKEPKMLFALEDFLRQHKMHSLYYCDEHHCEDTESFEDMWWKS